MRDHPSAYGRLVRTGGADDRRSGSGREGRSYHHDQSRSRWYRTADLRLGCRIRTSWDPNADPTRPGCLVTPPAPAGRSRGCVDRGRGRADEPGVTAAAGAARIDRDQLAQYLTRVLAGRVEVLDLRPLKAEGNDADDPKGFGYGVPFEVE